MAAPDPRVTIVLARRFANALEMIMNGKQEVKVEHVVIVTTAAQKLFRILEAMPGVAPPKAEKETPCATKP